MKKFISMAIPIIALIFFVLIMLSGNYLKRPLGKDDDMPKAIEVVIKNVEENKWEESYKNTEQLNQVWNKVIKRIQFSSERDEINGLSKNIARAKGAIMAKDKGLVLAELKEAYEHWNQLAK